MININDLCFVDFETRSRAPLTGKKSVGAWRYSIDPSTKPLCLSYAFGKEEPFIWIEGQPPPRALMSWIEAGKAISGWNSMSFERAIWTNIMATRYGWVDPDPRQYYDTMLDAVTLALPASLGDCAKALFMYDKKMELGKKLIQRLCKPITAGKMKGRFRSRAEFPEDFADLYLYCKQDVRTERGIWIELPDHLEGLEREHALMIMRMNERGLPLDVDLIDAVVQGLELDAVYKQQEFKDLTGIDKPTQREKFRVWMNDNGVKIPNLTKETVAQIDHSLLKPKVKKALDVYEASNNSSTAKFPKLQTMLCPDNTVKNNLIFNKANTGRVAGAGFQAQNLPAVSSKYVNDIILMFLERKFDFIEHWCGTQHAAKLMVRSSIKAPDFYKFLGGDLKGIEAKGTAWIAGEQDVLDNFRRGVDAYVSSAMGMYNKAAIDITKDDRQSGKVAVLSGGFGGGYRALMRMAAKYGMDLTVPEAKIIVRDFRKARKKLVEAWQNFQEAAELATAHGGSVPVKGTEGKVSFHRQGNFLFMVLPSGRKLSFPFPDIREMPYFGRTVMALSAMWVDSSPGGNHKWKRRILTGASLFQSAVQASCRDVLFLSHAKAERESYPAVLSIHDEGLHLVPDTPEYSMNNLRKMMEIEDEIPWAKGLPIGADLWEGYRYGKK